MASAPVAGFLDHFNRFGLSMMPTSGSFLPIKLILWLLGYNHSPTRQRPHQNSSVEAEQLNDELGVDVWRPGDDVKRRHRRQVCRLQPVDHQQRFGTRLYQIHRQLLAKLWHKDRFKVFEASNSRHPVEWVIERTSLPTKSPENIILTN